MRLTDRRSAPTPVRWEPMCELEQAAEHIRQMLQETLGAAPPAAAEPPPWIPAVDVEETDDAYVLEAELPGVEREDVEIELVGNQLVVAGELKERERAGIVRRRTRKVGRFEYRIGLPESVDADRIEAKLDHGVLTIRIPKSKPTQPRRIDISS